MKQKSLLQQKITDSESVKEEKIKLIAEKWLELEEWKSQLLKVQEERKRVEKDLEEKENENRQVMV